MIPVKKTRPMKAPPKKKKKKKSNGSVPASSSSSFSFEENEIRAPDSNLAARVNLDAFQRALKNLSIAPQSSSTSSLSSSSSRIQNYPRLRFDVGTRVEFKYTDRSKNESHEITGTISAHWVKCPCRACREEGSEDRFPYEVAVDEAWKDLIDNETWLLQRDNNEYVRLETTGCFTSKRRPKLRFEVGDRVQATVSAYSDNKTTMWETGTIVNVWSRPSGWNLSDGCALPYEIRIHDVTKEHLHAERDIVYAPYDADECVRKERRETVGPPTALSKVFLELPDLFEKEILWRLSTGDLKRFALSSKKCYERVKRSFNVHDFEDLTLEQLEKGPSPLMALFEKEEYKSVLARVSSFMNPTDVKFACLATKTILSGLKRTGWNVSQHRKGMVPDSRVSTPYHGAWFIHEFSSLNTLKKFFHSFYYHELYEDQVQKFLDAVWVGLTVIGNMEFVDWWRNEKLCGEDKWHPVVPKIARQEGNEEFAKALIDRGCSDGPMPQRFRCCFDCPNAVYQISYGSSDENE